ncbi:MAG: Lnb N-terminal periplasmic domain-containing protein [Gammaproteobacteria bacterium]
MTPASARLRRVALAALALALAAAAAALLFRVPSNDRQWSLDQQRLPVAEVAGDTVTLRNIRNFSYRSEYDFSPAYYDRTFSLEDVVDVDYIVEPLASVAAAHTFLSFGLRSGERIAISVEIRKQGGEVFNPLLGLFNEYELMYVVADERDVVALRVIHRGNPVHAYPTTATPPQARALLADMLARLNQIAAEPEFYNTLTNNCATNIAAHVNAIAPRSVPWNWRLLLPRTSDAYAQRLGLIAQGQLLEEARARYRVNEAVRRHPDDPDFSRRIREGR